MTISQKLSNKELFTQDNSYADNIGLTTLVNNVL